MTSTLTFQDDPRSSTKNLYQEIRKNSATHDTFNRLHSIQHDIGFVRKVSEEWYHGQFKVVANQRCGSWYTDPTASMTCPTTYAYFKSTDGHTNAWDFSVRRSNLGLIKFAVEQGGFIIVDSTRRGKRMPDALSKTIPIWCTVINRARLRLQPDLATSGWNTEFYTPPNIVSASEKSQIEARIEGWVDNLVNSSLTIPTLSKPLRPIFIHPGTSYPPSLPLPGSSDAPFIPIICLSASTFISHGGPEARRDAWGTFEYVQGSGDDDELWGKGIKPFHFFLERESLLSASREDLPGMIGKLVEREKELGGGKGLSSSVVSGLDVWCQVPKGSGIWLGTNNGDPTPSDLETKRYKTITFLHSDVPSIERIESRPSPPGHQTGTTEQLVIRLQEGKKKKTDLDYATQVLPAVFDFVSVPARRKDDDVDVNVGDERGTDSILIRDWNGKSLGVGVAICLSWFRVDDRGQRRDPSSSVPTPTKDDLRKRLEWILDARQGTNPSRLVLKAVNEYLISSKYK